MAVTHGGTNANNSLTSLAFSGGADMLDADLATIRQNIKDDLLGAFGNVWPDAFSRQGLLYVPNRGVLKVLPGDVVMVDTNSGWPILVSANVLNRGGTPWHNA